MLTGLAERALKERVLSRTRLDSGARHTTARLFRYVVLLIGVTLILQNVGIKLAALGFLAGAVGVGVGFGLQNIVSNFISGLIVMIEPPVKVGDRIEIGGLEGDVINVGLRATTLSTARRALLIVPNQKLITETVRNWAAEGDRSSLVVALKVADEHDPRQVQALLEDAALQLPGISAEVRPTVDLVGVDAGGHSFQVQAWIGGDSEERARALSSLHFLTLERLRRAEVRLA